MRTTAGRIVGRIVPAQTITPFPDETVLVDTKMTEHGIKVWIGHKKNPNVNGWVVFGHGQTKRFLPDQRSGTTKQVDVVTQALELVLQNPRLFCQDLT